MAATITLSIRLGKKIGLFLTNKKVFLSGFSYCAHLLNLFHLAFTYTLLYLQLAINKNCCASFTLIRSFARKIYLNRLLTLVIGLKSEEQSPIL